MCDSVFNVNHGYRVRALTNSLYKRMKLSFLLYICIVGIHTNKHLYAKYLQTGTIYVSKPLQYLCTKNYVNRIMGRVVGLNIFSVS